MASCCLSWRDAVWYCVLSHVCCLCIALLRWCGLCRMQMAAACQALLLNTCLSWFSFVKKRVGPGFLRRIQIVEIESSRSARVFVLDKFSGALTIPSKQSCVFQDHSLQPLSSSASNQVPWPWMATAQFRCIPICYDARLIVETQCEDYGQSFRDLKVQDAPIIGNTDSYEKTSEFSSSWQCKDV